MNMLRNPVTPYHEMPITVALKAVRQKVYREAHCIECGMPFCTITDKVVTIMDFDTPVMDLRPDIIGVVGAYCPRRQCQQRYRFEFAT